MRPRYWPATTPAEATRLKAMLRTLIDRSRTRRGRLKSPPKPAAFADIAPLLPLGRERGRG